MRNENKNNLRPGIVHRLTEIGDKVIREELAELFSKREGFRRLSVEASREAQRSMAIAEIAKAKAQTVINETQLAEIDFMIKAGEAFDDINTEPIWQIRRGSAPDGSLEVIFECLMSESDLQNMQSKQASIIRQKINSDDKDDIGNILD